ncbi:DUF1295 domain-containing protein [Arcanobacterium phocae]|uniref:DUF1295 domain-containing protein n=1 Tax=Arcanobacterium phocae TaxID=131112 RepID=UPI001C0F166E|nr:DUF1295 domain-containing protein [Arcanobacterium phocae]
MRNIAIALTVFFIGLGISLGGTRSSQALGALPIVVILVLLVFGIQWIMFVHSWLKSSDRFFDLTGSFTYICLTIFALVSSDISDFRSYLLGILVIIWATRLGAYLYRRIKSSGRDSRFDEILKSPSRLFLVWSLQGLWITLTALAAWIAITTTNSHPFGVVEAVGITLWLVGFSLEAVSDYQKSQFRMDPNNQGKFISSGLWSVSRHPNYFGEILIWIAVLVIASPVLHGWDWIAIISPLFVFFLITKVSGIPLLEKKAEEKWGGQPDYVAYKKATPVLIPKLF